jgi:hypothetical protein
MSDKKTAKALQADTEFKMALGWLTAAAVSIASWAGLA